MKTLKFIVLTFLLTIFVSLPFGYAQDAAVNERLVRLIYLVPNDRKPQPDIDSKLDELIKETQQFYADEMERHGYGRKTFMFEADENGNAIVHHVNGQFDDAYYQIDPTWKIDTELQDQFDYYNGVYIITVEISSDTFDDGGACGYGGNVGFGGQVYLPASGHCFDDNTLTAHELGHAFGLQHDFRNQSYVMSYGWLRTELSDCAASMLNVHPFFNQNKEIKRNHNTRIQLLSSKFDTTPPHALRLRFEINDPDGLVQAQLLKSTTGTSVAAGFHELVTWKALRGVNESIEFATTTILNDVWIHVIDTDGNYVKEVFDIDFTALTPETDTVHIPDAGLAAAIRKHFDYPSKKQITSFDMARLSYLKAYDRGITDLTGLEHAVTMEYLNINSNQIQDLTPILALPQLRKIYISKNPFIDLTQVSELTQLTRLEIVNSQLRDITFLTKLTHLTELLLGGNQISDLTPLSNLTRLDTLWLSSNQITDITPLANLTHLTWLKLSENQIRDITPLKNLTRLQSLNLQINQISDIRPLKRLVELRSLFIDRNPLIDDITGLEDMTQLKYLQLPNPLITDITPLRRLTKLVELYMKNNQVSDITPLADMTELRALGLNNSQITDITPLANMTQLFELYLDNNQISDITPLSRLTKLQWLTLCENQISDITPLSRLTKLEWLGLCENQISDLSTLLQLFNLKRLWIYGNPLTDLQPLLNLKRRAPK